MAGVTNESLDALLERKGVHAEIRQQVRDKGFANVIHFAGAIAEDELSEWFMHSTSLVPSDRDTDGRITNWAQESLVPRSKPSLPLGRAPVSLQGIPILMGWGVGLRGLVTSYPSLGNQRILPLSLLFRPPVGASGR